MTSAIEKEYLKSIGQQPKPAKKMTLQDEYSYSLGLKPKEAKKEPAKKSLLKQAKEYVSEAVEPLDFKVEPAAVFKELSSRPMGAPIDPLLLKRVGKGALNLAKSTGAGLAQKGLRLANFAKDAISPSDTDYIDKATQYLESVKEKAAAENPSLKRGWLKLTKDVVPKNVAGGVAKGVAGTAEMFTNPVMAAENIAMFRAGPVALTAAYGPDLLAGVAGGAKDAFTKAKEGKAGESAQAATQAALSALGSYGIGRSLYKGKIRPVIDDITAPKQNLTGELLKEAAQLESKAPVMSKDAPPLPREYWPVGQKSEANVMAPEAVFDTKAKTVTTIVPKKKLRRDLTAEQNQIWVENPEYAAAKKVSGSAADLIFKPEQRGYFTERASTAVLPEKVKNIVQEETKPFAKRKQVIEEEKTPDFVRATPEGEVFTAFTPEEIAQITGSKKPLKKESVKPESAKTLQLQSEALQAGRVPAMLITPGANVPRNIPPNLQRLDTPVGIWVYNPEQITAETIGKKIADGTHGEILGHVEPKSVKTNKAVSAITKDGVEAKTSMVSPENVSQQAAMLKKQFPESEILIGGKDLVQDVLSKREKANLPKTKDESGAVGFGKHDSPFKGDPVYQKAMQMAARDAAKQKVSIKDLAKEAPMKAGVEIVDPTLPLTSALKQAQKDNQFSIIPKHDIDLHIQRSKTYKAQVNQFIKDNQLDKVIQQVPDEKLFDQYLKAKRNIELSQKGIETGRNLSDDLAIANRFSKEFQPYEAVVRQYRDALMKYAVDSGIVSRDTAKMLLDTSPEYVPFNRVLDDAMTDIPHKPKGVANLSKQTFIQKIKGSKKPINNVIENFLDQTDRLFAQGERNNAAKTFYSYKDLPGFEGMMREVPVDSKTKHFFEFYENGSKKRIEVLPEFEAAMKSLGQDAIGLIGKIMLNMGRVFKVGTTGLNPAFTIANPTKDISSAAVNSSMAVTNPVNIFKSIVSTVKGDEFYKQLEANGSIMSSFDALREASSQTRKSLRAKRDTRSNIKYKLMNPSEMFRDIENIFGFTEKPTRVNVAKTTYDRMRKAGMNHENAMAVASMEAAYATGNFVRRGNKGNVMAALLNPYLPASIAGLRSNFRAFSKNPGLAALRLTTVVGLPVLFATLHNLESSKKKSVYRDIRDFEKENNILILSDSSKKDEKGFRYQDVYKMPLPPGYTGYAKIIRTMAENLYEKDPKAAMEILDGIIKQVSPIDPSVKGLVSSGLGPVLKGFTQYLTNYRVFEDKKATPAYMLKRPKQDRYYQGWTSSVVRKLSKFLDTEPIRTQYFIKDVFGSASLNLLHAVDTILNQSGMIDEKDIGGKSIMEAIEERFHGASAGQVADEQRRMRERK